MSQKAFADKMDMYPSQVSDYIAMRKLMSIETAKTAAEIIGCHIDDLYEWVEIKRSVSKRSRRIKE